MTNNDKNNMKTNKYLQLGLFIGCIALLAGCSDPVKSRMGGYSYQIAKQEVTIDDTVSIVLTGEMGALQMEQIQDDSILLTFNSLKGDVYTTTGKIDNDDIVLQPFERTLSVTYTVTQQDLLRPVDKTLNETYNIQVSGSAEMHDETIHFMLQYNGEGVSNDKQLVGEDILMVAKKN